MPRPPTPTELKIAQGNPGHRPVPAVVNIGSKVVSAPAPDHLSDAQVEVWEEIAPQLVSAGLLSDVDYPMLEGLCVQVALARSIQEEMERAIRNGDYVIPGAKGGLIANPIFAIQRNAWNQALQLAREFGLTPSSRGKLGLVGMKGKTLKDDYETRQAKKASEAVLPYDIEIESED